MTTTTLTSPHPRHASSTLIVPTTQNTAPVVEHRCLYTHDLKRKQKRWQDGFLKFHTFNKRVMVYDTPRNYIGDSHWRENDLVQDGDEIELDRGVLVQVGEAIGRADQDLSEVLAKRKNPPNIQVNGQHASRAATTDSVIVAVTQPSQILKPKPLNAVLGTPKGRIGRATVPTKSPYDQRLEIRNLAQSGEKPPKRRKIENFSLNESMVLSRSLDTNTAAIRTALNDVREDNNAMSHASRNNEVQGSSSRLRLGAGPLKNDSGLASLGTPRAHLLTQGRDATGRMRKPREKQAAEVNNKAIFVISSDDEDVRADRQKQRSKCAIGEDVDKSRKSNDIPTSCTKVVMVDAVSPQTQQTSGEPSIPDELDTLGIRKTRMRLRIAPRRLRKKLVYRDLLPQGQFRANEGCSTTPAMTKYHGASKRRPSDDIGSLSAFHQAEQDRIEARLKKSHVRRLNHRNTPGFPTSDDSAAVCEKTKSKARRTASSTKSGDHDVSFASSSEEQIHPMVLGLEPTLYDRNISLAKMDEILLSRSLPISNPPSRPFPPQPQCPNHVTGECSTFAAAAKSLENDPDTICRAQISKTQIPSSPGFQTQDFQSLCTATQKGLTAKEPSTVAKPGEDHQECSPSKNLATDLIESSQPLALEDSNSNTVPNDIIPASHPPTSRPVPLPQSPLQDPPAPFNKTKPLPNFKPPTRHSPLKKAISDTSSIRPPAAAAALTSAPPRGPAETAEKRSGTEQVADAWSREAWDLFGCRRDGVTCAFGEFVGQVG